MSNIELSLEDIIKKNKSGRGGARKGGRRASSGGKLGAGPIRNAPNRLGVRPTPYSSRPRRNNPDGTWQHDLFEGGAGFKGGKPVGIETGTKLHISNLDHAVSTDDIKELFSEVGDLKRCSVNYDYSGRSKGTAEVVFARKYDAQMAVKRYNGVQLDGKPMKIECIGTNVPIPLTPSAVNGGFRGAGSASKAGRGFKRAGRPNKAVSGGRGGGGRQKREKVPKSAQELDADLDNYHTNHAEAMQTN